MTDTKNADIQQILAARQAEDAKREEVLAANKAEDEELSAFARNHPAGTAEWFCKQTLHNVPEEKRFILYTPGHRYRPVNTCDRGMWDPYVGAFVFYRHRGATKWKGPAIVACKDPMWDEWSVTLSNGKNIGMFYRSQLRLIPELQAKRLADRGFKYGDEVVIQRPRMEPLRTRIYSVLGKHIAVSDIVIPDAKLYKLHIVPLNWLKKA